MRARALTVCLLLVSAGCFESDEQAARLGNTSCDTAKYATFEGATALVHVSASCGTDRGDGSAASPFQTIAQGMAAAREDGAVLLAPGLYKETVTLKPGVALVGAAASGVGLSVIAPPAGAVGISAKGTGAVTIAGVTVKGATGVGILIDGVDVLLQTTIVEATKTGADRTAQPGHGVQVTGSSVVELESVTLKNNGGVGLVAAGTGNVSIIDPTFSKSPEKPTSSQAIIDPTFFVSGAVVTGNQAGGVAIIDPTFLTDPTSIIDPTFKSWPSIIDPTFAVELRGVDLSFNTGFGLALYGASAKVGATAVRGTKVDGEGFAEGVVIAGRSVAGPAGKQAVELDEDTVVGGNAGAGVLVVGNAAVELKGDVSFNAIGGVWSQGSTADVRLRSKATVRSNALVGAVAGAGASLLVDGATIKGTSIYNYTNAAGDSADVADGVSAFANATVALLSATVESNARMGVVVSGAETMKVDDTRITGNETGVAVTEAGAVHMDVDPDSNQIAGNGTEMETDLVDLVVQVGRCRTVGHDDPELVPSECHPTVPGSSFRD